MNLKPSLVFVCCVFLWMLCGSWGFFAHQRINRMAIFTLPRGMIRFYKHNAGYLTEHSTDPDKRRYTDINEGPRHFLDTERYGQSPFDSLPERWKDAVAKYTEDTLAAYGTVPWQIEKTYYSLVKAFQRRDSLAILRISAHLGHYISDAHVPLHVTWNYNGQFTRQTGIHGFWESRLPELFSDDYNYFVGRAEYISNPLKEAWTIVKNSHLYKDSVFSIEARLSASFPSDMKYSFSERRGIVTKQYSREYAAAFHQALNGMIERQMRAAIKKTGSYWFSAWVDAGQPDLTFSSSESPAKVESTK